MRSRPRSRFYKTLGFRLSLWYSAIFILSFLTLSIVSYLFVFSSIEDNRPAIAAKLSEYATIAERDGIQAVEDASRTPQHPSRRSTFFIRVVNPNNLTLFLSNPPLWEKFDLTHPSDQMLAGRWHYYTSKGDGDLLEVASARLHDNRLLQVGKSIQDRNEVLEHFRDTLLATIIPMVIIGLAGGSFLAYRALRPIHNLSLVARTIVDTSRFDSRVPTHDTGGELNELVIVFNQMLGKIELLIQSMKEALDNVAHDLRTPVTRLRGVAEAALRTEADGNTCREALADCLEESERVMTMLNTLMDISEAETGMMKLSLENVNLGELIDEVADLYGYVGAEKSIALSTEAPRDIWLVADHGRLRQVLANLVDNAIKYTPCGGRVDIKAFENGQEAVVLVKDNGIGIPPDDLPRIWDRLYRGDKSRSQRGLGLGLSLVKAVVQAHHGKIEAATNASGGSVFSLYLPLSPSAWSQPFKNVIFRKGSGND
jgi:signal transduction histidine kinase